MSEWDSMDLIYLVGVLVLVLSALSIRKLSVGFVLRSLVTWALIIVISVKYLIFVLRADNRGEGGILAAPFTQGDGRAAEQLRRVVALALDQEGAPGVDLAGVVEGVAPDSERGAEHLLVAGIKTRAHAGHHAQCVGNTGNAGSSNVFTSDDINCSGCLGYRFCLFGDAVYFDLQ